MSEAKHTPGPWVLDDDMPGSIFSDDATGSIVARCRGVGFEYAPRPIEEWQANARLIAAAPDLDAAAGFAITALAFAQETYDHYAQTTAAKKALIAAQNKARGHEPAMRDVTPKRGKIEGKP